MALCIWKGPRAKESRQPLEDRRGKKIYSRPSRKESSLTNDTLIFTQ